MSVPTLRRLPLLAAKCAQRPSASFPRLLGLPRLLLRLTQAHDQGDKQAQENVPRDKKVTIGLVK
jgi:hypothetical protein